MKSSESFSLIRDGLRRSCRELGLSLRGEDTFLLRPYMLGAYEDMKQYLQEGNHPLPTAFFADNDMIALGAVKALSDHGIRVPEDISIIGFDDLPFSSISAPPLTTLRVPKQEMGRVAVRRIAEIIKTGEDLCLKQQVLPAFIERKSVKTISNG